MEGEAGSFRLSKGSLLLFRSFQKTWRGPLSALLRRVLWISPPSVLVFLAMGRAHSVVLHARVGIKLRDWCARAGIELAAHRHVADRDSYLGLHSLNLLLHWHALVLGRHGRRPLWVATATALPAAVDAADDDADEEDAADGSADDERKGIVPFAPQKRQIPAVIRIDAVCTGRGSFALTELASMVPRGDEGHPRHLPSRRRRVEGAFEIGAAHR